MTFYQQILNSLVEKRLTKVFDLLHVGIGKIQKGEYADRLEGLQTTYNLLLQYFLQNIDDPQRQEIYTKLIADLYKLADDVNDTQLESGSSLFEYMQMRHFKAGTISDMNSIAKAFTDYNDGVLPRNIYETALGDWFNTLWLNTHYTTEIQQYYTKIVFSTEGDNNIKCLAISALTLNLWRHFSEEKLTLLMDTCLQTQSYPQQRALVGLCFILAKYDIRFEYFPHLKTRLSILKERDDILQKLEQIIMQIIRTSETEEISKKMTDEIISQMLEANPRLKDKLKTDSFLKLDDVNEPNPEWNEFLEESGIGKKLQEFSEMQMSGSDVYMSTFSSLKQLPFFDETYHWFLPFDIHFSAIMSLFSEETKSILSTFVKSDTLCNSDKYSFCLAILQMPIEQQQAMQNAFSADMEQINEQLTDDIAPSKREQKASNQYIQDLYRFFKLHKHKREMNDMFDYALKIHKTSVFQLLVPNKNAQLNIGNFYFVKKCYTQALEIFEPAEKELPTVELYQKIAYSRQQLGHLAEAMAAYERADLIASDNIWTLKHMAACARLQGNTEKALHYYQYLDQLKPADKKNQLNLGLCYLDLKQNDNALRIYYKLDIEYPNDTQVWRALAWSLFVAKNYEQSQKYWQKILDKKPTAQDYLNAAHNVWCLQQRNTALQLYKKSNKVSENQDVFWKNFQDDKVYLLQQGISEEDLTLMIDAI